jgi:hypothetical protein
VKRHEYNVKHHVSWYPFSQIDKKNLFTVLQMV